MGGEKAPSAKSYRFVGTLDTLVWVKFLIRVAGRYVSLHMQRLILTHKCGGLGGARVGTFW